MAMTPTSPWQVIISTGRKPTGPGRNMLRDAAAQRRRRHAARSNSRRKEQLPADCAEMPAAGLRYTQFTKRLILYRRRHAAIRQTPINNTSVPALTLLFVWPVSPQLSVSHRRHLLLYSNTPPPTPARRPAKLPRGNVQRQRHA